MEFFSKKKISGNPLKSSQFSTVFAILVPAHNEAKKLEGTLLSIEKALEKSGSSANIQIALDSCTDDSSQVLENIRVRMAHSKLDVFPVEFRDKWKTLKALVAATSPQTEWVILVDAGTVWSEDLLLKMLPEMENPEVLSVAPTYQMEGASRLNRLFWTVERTIKDLENRVQGPISVHGACVAYRKKALQQIFIQLPDVMFKNDDIILPLALRVFFPKQSLVYLSSAVVFDRAELEDLSFQTQFKRRKRMILGNLQWIRWLLHESLQTSIPIRVWGVALRRILRPFWFWSFLILALGAASHFGWIGFLALAPAVLFPSAAIASAYAPFAWILKWDQKNSAWR